MAVTDHYIRFEIVDAVEEAPRGLLAHLHGERLRVDVVRDDVVRVAISRGGVFDESPTFAVCVDPFSREVTFAVERGDGVVRLRTPALVVSPGSTRSGWTSTGPTGAPSSRPRGTGRAAPGPTRP